jgi:hypothetical protein
VSCYGSLPGVMCGATRFLIRLSITDSYGLLSWEELAGRPDLRGPTYLTIP